MVINDYDAETLDIHRQLVDAKQAALDKAKNDRDEFVRDLLIKGAKPTELGRIAGLSRERVYQIKERRR
jgi:hypothetical protein